MDESVKRRERLKAMRTEASQTDNSNNVEASSVPGFLSNPLAETSASLPAHNFSAVPRFDYYTDPLSAFSGSKKRSMPETRDDPTPRIPSNVGPSAMQFSPSRQGAWNPAMAPPAHQFHSNNNHDQRMYPPQAPPHNYNHGQGMYPPQAPPHNPGPRGFPVANNPFSMPQPNYFPPNPPYPNQGSGQMGQPRFSSEQVRGNWSNQSPGPNPEYGDYSSHGSGRGRGHQFSVPDINPGGGQGRGNWSNQSPGPNPEYGDHTSHGSGRGRGNQFSGPDINPGEGQGRGNWSNQSPGPNPEYCDYLSHGSGRDRGHQFLGPDINPGGGRGRGRGSPGRGGRGRGRGSPGHGEPPRPEHLYQKSMVEDPWKLCQPVIWKILETWPSFSRTAESPQSWLPKSISLTSNTTRPVEVSNMSRSESLAESLAASLYETINEDDKQGM